MQCPALGRRIVSATNLARVSARPNGTAHPLIGFNHARENALEITPAPIGRTVDAGRWHRRVQAGPIAVYRCSLPDQSGSDAAQSVRIHRHLDGSGEKWCRTSLITWQKARRRPAPTRCQPFRQRHPDLASADAVSARRFRPQPVGPRAGKLSQGRRLCAGGHSRNRLDKCEVSA